MASLAPDGLVPPNPLTAIQEVNKIVNRDEAKNRVAVHTFDPEASPEEKGRAAGAQKDKLKSVNAEANDAGGKEMAVDTGHSNVLPTITVEDVDELDAAQEPTSPSGVVAPGALPAGPAPAIPDWYKVGWRAVGGIDQQGVAEGEVKDKAILDMFLKEQYYGEWYYNAGLIVVVIVVTHFLTRFGFGWGWLFIVMAFCTTYYSTSMTRFRRRARDDIQRELVKTRLMNVHESADWINHFLDRFWLIYEPVLSQTVIATVDQILSTNCPPFLDSLRLSTFTLGTKAPRIEKVKTYPDTPEDIITMDWGLSFSPNDTSDMTSREVANKVNPKIVLSVRVGKGIAAGTLPVLLEDMSFSGLMRVRIKLMTNFPHVQVVDLSFMEEPVFDYVLKPLGGDTFGFDIGNIPGLSTFIRGMVHSILGPMMYDPNFFTLNIEQMLSGEPLDAAVGVLQVTVHSARGLRGTKLGGGTPDPYVSLSINQRAELARTRYKHNTANPTWMETKFILVNSLTESLNLTVLDFNDHRKDFEMGFASFELAKLREDASHEGVEAPIFKDGKDKGILRFDVSFFPVLKPEPGSTEPLPDTKVGIVRLTIHQAKDLDNGKSITGDLNPLCKVHLGSSTQHIHKTARFKHTNNPVWESSTEFLCSDKESSIVTVKVIDDREILKDPVIGYVRLRLEDLLESKKEVGRDWWPLSGCKSGKVRLSAEWKPLNMAGSLHGADQYVPPIGVVRLWLKKAEDVKNVEATLGGKSDPYVRVQINNVTQGRTEVVNNNLSPEWDQIIYIPVHSLKETMMLECMDYQHLTKDRSLGYVELKVSALAQAGEGSSVYTSTGKRVGEDPIRLDKGSTKGKLYYEAEFLPAMRVKDVKFSSAPNAIERAVEGGSEYSAGDTVVSSDSASDLAVDVVPDGITASTPLGDDESLPPLSPTSPVSKGAKTSTDIRRSIDSTATFESRGTAATGKTGAADDEKRIEDDIPAMSKEELLRHQSGIVVFNVISGQLHKKGRLEVLLDDAYWPAFSTVRARSTHMQWEYIGEGFIKEMDFGRVWLRLNEADEGDKDDIVAEYKGDAKGFLEQALDGPAKFTLVDKHDEERTSVVEVEARYVPVPVKLEPRESINNQGLLQVELLSGRDIVAADRGGKSDPFVAFQLNGQKVYKSQTKKKTLNPDWHESFMVQVPSRVGADFTLEVFDWNQIEQAKSLGSAKIDLTDIEPFVGIERDIPLSHAKHGDKGSISLRLMFQPEIIAKSRKNTSTFSTAGRAMTQIGHIPVGAGRGVFHGVTGVFRRGGGSGSEEEEDDRASYKNLPAGQASQAIDSVTGVLSPLNTGSVTFPPSNGNGNGLQAGELGTLRVTVMDAKDLSTHEIKPYVTVRVGDKEQKTKHVKSSTPEWDECLTFVAGPSQQKLYVWVHDYKTLGKDKLLGSGEVEVWRHIKPDTSPSAEVSCELREGQGRLRLKLEFNNEPVTARPRHSLSFSSLNASTQAGAAAAGPPPSPSRFSLSGRRSRQE
ncbi:tricalbin [Trametopsis cervina]|nr:tricalbin [Trametopsis cervina]